MKLKKRPQARITLEEGLRFAETLAREVFTGHPPDTTRMVELLTPYIGNTAARRVSFLHEPVRCQLCKRPLPLVAQCHKGCP